MPPPTIVGAPALKLPLLQRDVKSLLLPGLWLLFVVVNLWVVIRNGIPLFNAAFSSDDERAAGNLFGVSGISYLGLSFGAPFAVNLWGLAAGLFFGLVIVPNRPDWDNGKRFALGGMAFAMMLGRFITGTLVGLAVAYAGPREPV